MLAELEAELQRLAPERRARGAEGVADLLRLLGPLSTDEVQERCAEGVDGRDALETLAATRRVVEVRVAGVERWAAVEDVGRLRDGLGVAVPPGTPDAFTDPVEDPLADLVVPLRPHPRAVHHRRRRRPARPRRRRGPADPAAAGRPRAGARRRVPAGARPGWSGATPRCCGRCGAGSLARLRKEVEPVPPAALGRFLPAWQHVGGKLRGVDGVVSVIDQLAGCPVPASALEPLVLAARVRDYEPSYLDELTASGEVLWAGHASLPGADGWVSLHLADQAPLTLPEHEPLRAQ